MQISFCAALLNFLLFGIRSWRPINRSHQDYTTPLCFLRQIIPQVYQGKVMTVISSIADLVLHGGRHPMLQGCIGFVRNVLC